MKLAFLPEKTFSCSFFVLEELFNKGDSVRFYSRVLKREYLPQTKHVPT